MKTLVTVQHTFPALRRFLQQTCEIIYAFATNNVSLVQISQQWKELYLKSTVPTYMHYNGCEFRRNRSTIKNTLFEDQCIFPVVSQLQLKGFPREFIHATHGTCCSFPVSFAVIGEYLRTLYLKSTVMSALSVSITDIFLKIHICDTIHMCHKCCKFSCNRSQKHFTWTAMYLLAVSQVPPKGFFWKFISGTQYICITKAVNLVTISQ